MEPIKNHSNCCRILVSVSALALLSACSATNDINTGTQTNSPAQPVVTNPPDTDSDTIAPDAGGAATPDVNADTDNSTSTPDTGTGSSGTDSADQNSNDTNTADTTDSSAPATPAANTPVVDDSLVANASTVVCEASLETFRDTMVAMVNHSRLSARQCGTSAAAAVGVVQWNEQLAVAAENHAQDMVDVNFFSHTGSDGLSVADRAEASGYIWRAVGENIAAGQRDIAEVHQGWLDSAGHCRNIMNALYTEIGAACVNGAATDFGNYWVVVFGDQR